MPGLMQAWPTVAACWSPAMPSTGTGAPRMSAVATPSSPEQSTTLGSSGAGTPSSFSRPSSQVPLWMSSSRLRLALVASLACTLPPVSRHSRKHLDGAGRQRALLRRGAAAGDVVEDPGDLGAGEIRIEDQAGLGRDLAFMAGALQRLAAVGGAAVLPDDGVVDRLAGGAVPHHGRLALVGDADAGQRLGVELGVGRARRGRPRPWPTRSPRRRARPSRAWERSAAAPSAPLATGRPAASNTMARVLVVPWSMARMCLAAIPRS